jgi:diguanylate cyclase (GGDEF)-like protein
MSLDPALEIRQLRTQIRSLLAEARQNEEKMRRFDEVERQLIGTSALPELIRFVVHHYRAAFDLDAVTLALLDPEYELQRMLEATGWSLEQNPDLVFLSAATDLDVLYGVKQQPILDAFREIVHGRLFPDITRPPASVALLPLVRQDLLIGSLNLGSCKADRFVNGHGTDFLERLAGIVAISLENAANHERLKLVGLTDALTSVHNRRYFIQRLREECAFAQRYQKDLALMFLDVDHFKRINDNFGHQSGDQVLRDVAQFIKSQLRPSDIIARYGGEEFVVLLPHTGVDHAMEVAERIRSGVANTVFRAQEGRSLQVTISIGIATHKGEGEDRPPEVLGDELVAVADRAVFKAKNIGRNRVVGEVAY